MQHDLMELQKEAFLSYIAPYANNTSKTQASHRQRFWREHPEWKLLNVMRWAKRACDEKIGARWAVEEGYVDGFYNFSSFEKFMKQYAPVEVKECFPHDMDEALRLTEEYVAEIVK